MNKRSLLKNSYVLNLLGLILVSIVLIIAVLFGLNRYTHHGKTVDVPDVKGLLVDDAKVFFTNKQLRFAVVDSVFIKGMTPESIFETIPPVGSKVKEGRVIYLKLVAFLPQLIPIPEVKDFPLRQSMATLRSLGFEKVEIKLVPGDFQDLVLGIESRGKLLEAGQRVTADTPLSLLVSSGSGDVLQLENPADSTATGLDSDKVKSNESWF